MMECDMPSKPEVIPTGGNINKPINLEQGPVNTSLLLKQYWDAEAHLNTLKVQKRQLDDQLYEASMLVRDLGRQIQASLAFISQQTRRPSPVARIATSATMVLFHGRNDPRNKKRYTSAAVGAARRKAQELLGHDDIPEEALKLIEKAEEKYFPKNPRS
jgi:hypothetical protein